MRPELRRLDAPAQAPQEAAVDGLFQAAARDPWSRVPRRAGTTTHPTQWGLRSPSTIRPTRSCSDGPGERGASLTTGPPRVHELGSRRSPWHPQHPPSRPLRVGITCHQARRGIVPTICWRSSLARGPSSSHRTCRARSSAPAGEVFRSMTRGARLAVALHHRREPGPAHQNRALAARLDHGRATTTASNWVVVDQSIDDVWGEGVGAVSRRPGALNVHPALRWTGLSRGSEHRDRPIDRAVVGHHRRRLHRAAGSAAHHHCSRCGDDPQVGGWCSAGCGPVPVDEPGCRSSGRRRDLHCQPQG